MKKNILAENMRRFYTKNLTEQQDNLDAPDLTDTPDLTDPADTPIGSKQDYEPGFTEMEEVVISYDTKTGKTTGKQADWQYNNPTKGKRKSNFWIAKDIDIIGMRTKIHRLAAEYADYMEDAIGLRIGPYVTSGYRGPRRQVNAMWYQWYRDPKYLKTSDEGGVGYKQSLAKPIETIFTKFRDNPREAKRQAIDFLKKQEKKGNYMSSHQLRGAVDFGLFKDSSRNDALYNFLEKSKKEGLIVSFIDERNKKSPHFHIKLK